MPLYYITRPAAGASLADVQAALLRAQLCAQEFEGLTWIRSFWDREGEVMKCFFTARSEEDMREHARRANVPFGEVAVVETIGPEDYSGLVSDLVPAATRE